MTETHDTDERVDEQGPFLLDASDPAYHGQAVYTPRTLRAYDTIVVKWSNRLVWRCPARRLLAHYDRHVSASHLDVGPGTGYYLERCRFPEEDAQITLLDPNSDVLRFAAHRLERRARRCTRPTSSSRSGWNRRRSGRSR